MLDQANSRTNRGLPRYVGVGEVCDALQCSRSTLSRMRRDKLFPEAEQIAPNRVGWRVEVLEQHFASQARSVAKLGVADPATLEPDQLIDSARDLIAQATSKRTGQPVDPTGMSIHTTRAVTLDEFKAAEAREFALMADRFAHIGDTRAVVLAAWILPQLRQFFEGVAVNKAARELFKSPERLQELGSLALYDDDWEEFEARVRAGDRPVT